MLMPSSGFHSETVLTLIDRVEQDQAATGAFICEASGSRLATVLLEEGRICWAVASGMRRRLTDLLLESSDPSLRREHLEKIYKECKGRNVPLGEELVRRGVVPAHGLRDALAEHTSEALIRIGKKTDVSFDWVAHRAPGYSPTYTFETLDIALRVAKKAFPEQVDRGLQLLAQSGLPGVAFFSEEGMDDAFPVAVTRLEELPVEARLTRRGHCFLALRKRIAGLGDAPPELAFWRSAQGPQFALSVYDDFTIAHFLTRPTDLGLLVKARMNT